MQNDTNIALGFGAIIVILLLATAIIPNSNTSQTNASNAIAIEHGVQIIGISVKGGYNPSNIEAKAGMPTELRFTTNGTYDCSSALAIPAIGYQKMLPATGTETVSLSADQASGMLQGQCGMGMYRFTIAFR